MTTYSTVIWRKARRSGQNGACVEVGVWRKALRSGQNGNCVEVKSAGAAILIRDSKYLRDPSNDPEAQPIISITVAQWSDFLEAVAGRSEALTEPAITVHADGSATLTSADGVALDYTPTEWLYFSEAVTEGEFDDLTDQWTPAKSQLTGV
ncbi:DUF397 domain-containing protein [Nocardia wallacei]|uniref:DUF397 domain-containing protein n=1 Tax=Nocardia wallacei TaxID=480035 RepID=A0A7G1KX65_9NOCA|nr:DUF397 domain-containing protein [Nocardia wallacei]BCK59411.1 hypothetical protein NWFMUON74_71830 [Nocardia wallacei]